MVRRYDEDLFKNSTMTFGEHLEELRICLFKSVLGLAAGFIIGLFVGTWVVDFIQTPLRNALKDYYKTESLANYKKAIGEDEDSKIDDLVNNKGYLFEEVYVDPQQVLRTLKNQRPDVVKGMKIAPPDPDSQLRESDLARIFLWRPGDEDSRIRLKSLNAQETFMIYIKASVIAGAIFASPWIFYQIWMFVGAGLYPHEKHYVHIFMPFSIGLFLLGAALAFFFVFEPVLNFLLNFNRMMGIDPDPRINEWLNFVLLMPLGFGVSFQLPLVMLFLERIGIFDVKTYLAKWRISVLVIAIAAMVLTPSGDPYSMLLMGIPLTVLYFGGVLLCKYMPKGEGLLPDYED
ncbi:MAG: twin-arginine translocase subunit TatC [Pirellulales bacterium]